MTRALAVAAWAFGLVAWGALVMFCIELFAVALLLCAASILLWGFRLYPDPADQSEETGVNR
ncbi:Uncharacterised protein [Mycobacteroides abscessus subsp. abscessus]|uniref:hypothetical protein n=1 Tax=Mycobacteroides abscessus TaxID=36809 RepID=UPI00092726B8|nr:hypothetical protein [Mycobacteroides abscessus]SHT25688.1 Uncharacterised protein [Mycobacteroides abscessus subsp. abscessus]SHU97833.1 Uncharacterised protein [Mycobacteroides abscessus subsp. abscessus]